MTYGKHAENGVTGRFEPEVTTQFLPGCRNCGASHPLARRPAMPAETCPDCGQPASQAGEVRIEDAELGGILGWLARGLYAIGAWLRKLAGSL